MRHCAASFIHALLIIVVPSLGSAQSGQSAPSAPSSIQSELSAIRLERIKTDPRYRQTRALCENNFVEFGWILKESAIETLNLGTLDSSAWGRFWQNDRMAPDLKYLVDSEPFRQAIADCDGTRKSTWNKIVSADTAGKVTGLVMTVAIWRAGGPVLRYISTLGRAGYVVHKALLFSFFAYTVDQLITLGRTLNHHDSAVAETTAVVNRNIENLRRSGEQLRIDLKHDYEQRALELQTLLADPMTSEATRVQAEGELQRLRTAASALVKIANE